jgi:hypothetical protein
MSFAVGGSTARGLAVPSLSWSDTRRSCSFIVEFKLTGDPGAFPG